MKLKKGFTLIELLVVIAIIGILATTLVPKLREQLAKAKDSKAVALLGVARTGIEILLIEKVVQDDVTSTGTIRISLSDIKKKIDTKSNELFVDEAYIPVGGTRATPDGDLTYGGRLILSKNQANWPADTFTSNNDIVEYTENGLEEHPGEEDRHMEKLYLALPIVNNLNPSIEYSTEGKSWRHDY